MIEVAADLAGIVIGILRSNAHILIPGSAARLIVIIAALALMNYGWGWTKWIIVAIQGFTAVTGFLLFVILISSSSGEPAIALIAIGMTVLYLMMAIVIACAPQIWGPVSTKRAQ